MLRGALEEPGERRATMTALAMNECTLGVQRPLAHGPSASSASTIERLGSLVQWLGTMQAAIRGRSKDDAACDAPFWETLLAALGSYDDADVFELLERSPEYPSLRRCFSERFGKYAHYRDITRSRRMVEAYRRSGGMDALSNNLRRFLAREEATLRSYTSGPIRRFASVGCGASPETFIYYATHLPDLESAVAIDAVDLAVKLARGVVEELEIPKSRIDLADGARFDYGGFDVVHVANYVTPKTAVLSAIAQTAQPGAIVVLRVPKLLETLICETIDLRRLHGLREVGRISSHYCKMDTLYLELHR
jgi:hypothetical protein